MSGLVKEGRPYVGVLYMGLMLTDGGPKVVEYNVRFGDPECQPLMLRLKTDLLEIIQACLDGSLDKIELEWDPRTAICVTMAAEGTLAAIRRAGLSPTSTKPKPLARVVFHAGTGTAPGESGDELVTTGGRVLSVCALGDNLDGARDAVYPACDTIEFHGAHFRRDIGKRHG